LVEALDLGDTALLQATVYETQRVRPVIDAAARRVVAPSIRLGDWVIPEGYTVTVNIGLTHQNASAFSDADRYMPERFLEDRPGTNTWVPFGGGNRRCPGASLANLEMVTVLRTLLEEFTLQQTSAQGERWRSRGVAFAPARGGLAVVQRRDARDGNEHRGASAIPPSEHSA
jgi:cytochrome P450